MWKCKLRRNYVSFEEFVAYDDIYGIAKTLGFESAREAWDENPTVTGSSNPEDFRIIKNDVKVEKE